MLRAAAAGVNHIDTAQFYGAGTVNELIREALYPYPDGLAIVSKVVPAVTQVALCYGPGRPASCARASRTISVRSAPVGWRP